MLHNIMAKLAVLLNSNQYQEDIRLNLFLEKSLRLNLKIYLKTKAFSKIKQIKIPTCIN